MCNRFAIFDWDNTVRRGYTLFSWIDYLCGNNYLSKVLQFDIERIKEQYNNHTITHDQYADYACSLFAKHLQGVHQDTIKFALSQYIIIDQRYLLDNIGKVFNALHQNSIDIIIISGAPELIISQYKKKFFIKSVYGFKEECRNSIYTGKVTYNYGYNKSAIVESLCKEYQCNPTIAFGDSESDLPMLDKAKYPFCVGHNLHLPYPTYTIENNSISDEMLQLINSI